MEEVSEKDMKKSWAEPLKALGNITKDKLDKVDKFITSELDDSESTDLPNREDKIFLSL